MQPTHLSGMYGFNASPYYFPSIQVFTLHRPIYRMPSSERLGYLSIDVKLEALSRIADQLYVRDKEQFYLVDDEGVIFYSGIERRSGARSRRLDTILPRSWRRQAAASKRTAPPRS